MNMSPAYECAVRSATASVLRAAERADQARDLDALKEALGAVRDAVIKASIIVRQAEDETRAEALKPYVENAA